MDRRSFLGLAGAGLVAGLANQKATWASQRAKGNPAGGNDLLRQVFYNDTWQALSYAAGYAKERPVPQEWKERMFVFEVDKTTDPWALTDSAARSLVPFRYHRPVNYDRIFVPKFVLEARGENELRQKENALVVKLLEACQDPKQVVNINNSLPRNYWNQERDRATHARRIGRIGGRPLGIAIGLSEAFRLVEGHFEPEMEMAGDHFATAHPDAHGHVLVNPETWLGDGVCPGIVDALRFATFGSKPDDFTECVWGARLLLSDAIPKGKVFVLPKPNYLGAFCLSDEGRSRNSGRWERIGVFVLNANFVSQLQLD